MPQLLVFAPIALREVDFYLEVAKCLKTLQPQSKVAFVSFIQQAQAQIEKAGFSVYDIFEYESQLHQHQENTSGDDTQKSSQDYMEAQRKYKITDLPALTLHEAVNFGITSQKTLSEKFLRYLEAHEDIFEDIKKDFPGHEIVGLQELGGFIAPLSFYYVCQRLGIRHVFFEPSYFKGRLNFVVDSLSPDTIKSYKDEVIPEAKEALEKIIETKQIAVPSKDTHHFRDMGLAKIFNRRNLERLSSKLISKYVFRQRQEYEHIGFHTQRYFKMLLNRRRSEGLYSRLEELKGQRIVYFPFHVQMDFALTVRSPHLFDQLSLVEELCQVLPPDMILVTKEHPASIGGFDFKRLSEVCRNKNFRILHPNINTFDVLKVVETVVTINSKAGAEALLKGLPVMVMGQAFYSESDLIYQTPSVKSVGEFLRSGSYRTGLWRDDARRLSFFSEAWRKSRPGELYNQSLKNIQLFTESLVQNLDKSKSSSTIIEKLSIPEATL